MVLVARRLIGVLPCTFKIFSYYHSVVILYLALESSQNRETIGLQAFVRSDQLELYLIPLGVLRYGTYLV